MGRSIDERPHEAIRAFLEEGWAHGSDSIDFIAMDDEELVFVDAATKCGGHGMPREEPDQERFERIAAAYLAEAEVEGLTSSRTHSYLLFSSLAVVGARHQMPDLVASKAYAISPCLSGKGCT